MFIKTSIYEMAKETRNKLRWDAVLDNKKFGIYIPKWRVPKPWPKAIFITISDETEKYKTYQPLIPEKANNDPILCAQPIFAELKLVKRHKHTIRYSPIVNDPLKWEIGEPYIPYCLLPKDYKEHLLIEINWKPLGIETNKSSKKEINILESQLRQKKVAEKLYINTDKVSAMLKIPFVTDNLVLYINEINRFARLTPEEEFKLAVRYKKYNDLEAAEKLVVSNLRFVVKIAYEYHNYGFKLADLIQEGNIGLIHAVKIFDPEKGYRLISYAIWWIRAYIHNYLIRSWNNVKIGTTQAQRKLFFKLSQAKKQLESISKTKPEFAEIASSQGIKGSESAEMDVLMGSRNISLDELIGDDGENSRMDFLAFEGENQEESLIKNETRSLVKQNITAALSGLDEREAYIILNRVMTDNPETLQEIGDKFNITRERVRQIEKQALKKVQLASLYLKPN